ncbi:myelin-associated glycoprotein isoform X3 [Larimichthys crocea]|uniref:myelin-associated glycoprotein isoform X3 n=1 Tax=Larimichthys crocea TaxID=215358 RepID=UPI0009010CB8|nr:myelin-associated glycoprotein isoform X3 [Larimichthys crocea]
MNSLKLTLFVCLCFKVIQTEASSWTAKVPSSIKGLPGSCVVIPCSYDHPDPGKTVTEFNGIWTEASTSQVIYHPVESKIVDPYRQRTELLGDISQKNCSLKIDPLKSSDHGPFVFRIEIKNYNSYSYVTNKVTITMNNEPDPVNFSVKEEVKEGETVSASCSVTHSCPAIPPTFTWSHSEKAHVQHQQLEGGQWKTTSTLSFHPTSADHNKPLKCNVKYKGGQTQQKSKNLRVKYAPEVNSTSSCSVNADLVKCRCIVASEPPSMIHFLLSDKILPSTKIEKNGSFTIGTLQAEFGSYTFVLCLANNTQGNATLMLPVNSNMQSLYIIIAVGVGVTLLIILLTVGVVKKCRGRSGDAPPLHMSTTGARKAVVLPDYAVTKRKEQYDDDVHCSAVYINDTNDAVYDNVETGYDDAVYANM